MRAFNSSVAEFKQTGSVESLKQFLNVQGDVNRLTADSAKVSHTAAGAWRSLSTAGKQFADNNLSKPLQELADWVGKLDPTQVQEFFENAKTAALGFLAVWATVKAAKIGGGIVRGAGGLIGSVTGGAKGGLGGAAGAAGTTPVYVVNMPAGGMGGDLADAASGGAGGKKAGKLGKLRSGAGVVGALVTAGTVGYQVGSYAYENYMQGNKAGDFVGEQVARLAALMGNKEAKESIERSKKAEAALEVMLKLPEGVTAQVNTAKTTPGTTVDLGNTTGVHS
jgi:hypothetical protein